MTRGTADLREMHTWYVYVHENLHAGELCLWNRAPGGVVQLQRTATGLLHVQV